MTSKLWLLKMTFIASFSFVFFYSITLLKTLFKLVHAITNKMQ